MPRLTDGLCPAARQDQALGTVDAPAGVDQSDPLEQERRIFYVGLTRASECVYLEVTPHAPSRFVAELGLAKPALVAPASKPRVRKPAASEGQTRAWRPIEDDALIAARDAGEDLDELAERLGRSRRAVDARLEILDAIRQRTEARRRRLAEEE
ncbi:hypothetical protein [Nannocystis pusilla]|uniref:hypothetical protein n=1 Tax=Nannocystis pusilla TaxID=889268 RepID=UPI003B837BFF